VHKQKQRLRSTRRVGKNAGVVTGSNHRGSSGEPTAGSGPATAASVPPIVIKKYANRRLYNTATSGYVTLDSLAQMVREQVDFVVYDARTGEDITRSVLTQIIFDEEGKGRGLLPIEFLRHLIRLYGDSLQTFVPCYLDMSMEALSRNQEQIRHYMAETLSGKTPLEQFEGFARQNLAFFERTMRMFAPFATAGADAPSRPEEPVRAEAPASPATERQNTEIEELRKQLLTMQQQINDLVIRT
jgi:polyhydroxyalkanoate synthesis repressor PhaR